MSPPRYQQAAAQVRAQIADGTLPPGAPAPSGAALARATGYSVLTCRRALRVLTADGTLVPGASSNARPRVPATDHRGRASADARRVLSAALAARRRAAGLTQPQLAGLLSLSVTTVAHAETGRTWQSRPFWETADQALHADGELLRLHDAYRTAAIPTDEAAAEAGDTATYTSTTEPAAVVTVDAPGPVTCITITWADGAATDVYPPGTYRG